MCYNDCITHLSHAKKLSSPLQHSESNHIKVALILPKLLEHTSWYTSCQTARTSCFSSETKCQEDDSSLCTLGKDHDSGSISLNVCSCLRGREEGGGGDRGDLFLYCPDSLAERRRHDHQKVITRFI